MANTFKNALLAASGTSLVTLYTAPVDTTVTIIGLACSNILAGNITCDVLVEDVSESVSAHLVKTAPIPPGGSLIAVGSEQKVILEAGDKIKVKSNTSASLDVILSVLEMT
jgi:hypothetical protein